ncbi:MAG: valine--tRNA ligase [Phycisphaeraceae bacterium]|nr:valine--tRNA ligase [Phycisphaeraceae bacterium]
MTPESASQQRGVDAGAGVPGETGMEKGYVPAKHEGRIASRWAEAGVFAADPGRVNRGERKAYAVLIPPPNVTDRLHLGHALNNTLQDVLVRAHRMMGYETLWMPGTDHAGIATQAVVERRLRKDGKLKGPLRTSMKREEFVATVQAFKDEYEATITGQLRAMGCSCDWDRQRFTMDAQCTAAVREAFFRLFKDGLIYRGKRLVNWDPVLQTAVADDECYDEEIEGAFYYLRYPLAAGREGGAVTWGELAARGYPGAGEHAPGEAAWVTVATTRPETYLGDTAVGVNPHDPRAAALRGLWVRLPLVGRVVPIVEDGYVVLPERYARTEEEKRDPKAGMATGFLKVTPAHDTNDYEIGRRHGLAMVNVFAPDATVSDKHGWSDVGGASRFVGLKREEARKQVVEAFKELGLLEAVKPHRHSVKHSDRSKAVVEPYLSDQWYVKVTDPSMAAAANDALYTGQLTFHPQRYLKTYEQWHDTIRDWCISRQLWWGHRIPVWSKTRVASGEAETVRLPDSLEKWKLEDRVAFQFQTQAFTDCDLKLFHVCVRNESDLEIVRALEANGLFVRDPDVLDTWFSSALWPMSTMGWPEPGKFAGNAGMLEAFNPTSVLCTAREIITLWVSRMVMFNRYFMGAGKGRGPAPFRDVFIHAVIQDGEGRKMSKSLGNGVDPLDIIASHGADAMRFTLASMTTQTQDVRMPVQKDAATGRNTSPKFDLGRNFANKLWNAARFALTMVPRGGSAGGPVSRGDLTLADRWMLSRLAGATAKVNAALGQYEFSVYAQTMYDLLWRDYCDWYLEAVKPTVAQRPAQQAVLVHALRTILRLLHPIMPFVTEAVHEQSRGIAAAEIPGLRLGPERVGGLLCTAPWPEIDGAWADAEADAAFGRAQEIVEAILRARSEHKVPPRKRITLHAPAAIVREVELAGGVVQTRADLERATAEAPAAGSSLITVPLGAAELLLSGAVEALDAGAERERLVKLIGELDKSIGALEGRLANPGYAQRAPAKLVEESRQQLEAKKAEREAARASLGRLEG